MCVGETVGRKERSLGEYKLATAAGSLVCSASFHDLKLAYAQHAICHKRPYSAQVQMRHTDIITNSKQARQPKWFIFHSVAQAWDRQSRSYSP